MYAGFGGIGDGGQKADHFVYCRPVAAGGHWADSGRGKNGAGGRLQRKAGSRPADADVDGRGEGDEAPGRFGADGGGPPRHRPDGRAVHLHHHHSGQSRR